MHYLNINSFVLKVQSLAASSWYWLGHDEGMLPTIRLRGQLNERQVSTPAPTTAITTSISNTKYDPIMTRLTGVTPCLLVLRILCLYRQLT